MRLVRTLASARLAAVLIALLVAAGVVSFVVPQSSHSGLTLYEEWSANNPTLAAAAAATGADDVFSSVWFYAILALLAVNLSTCTALRIMRRRDANRHVPAAPPASAHTVGEGVDAQPAFDRLRTAFRGWHVTRASDGERTIIRVDGGRRGFAGSVVLHAGLLLLIAGGVVSGLTRFDGRMVLTEGETLPDAPASYLGSASEPEWGHCLPALRDQTGFVALRL